MKMQKNAGGLQLAVYVLGKYQNMLLDSLYIYLKQDKAKKITVNVYNSKQGPSLKRYVASIEKRRRTKIC